MLYRTSIFTESQCISYPHSHIFVMLYREVPAAFGPYKTCVVGKQNQGVGAEGPISIIELGAHCLHGQHISSLNTTGPPPLVCVIAVCVCVWDVSPSRSPCTPQVSGGAGPSPQPLTWGAPPPLPLPSTPCITTILSSPVRLFLFPEALCRN